ncbi:MAG: family 20 glycosylhydrolase [Spirochaetia bacterium]
MKNFISIEKLPKELKAGLKAVSDFIPLKDENGDTLTVRFNRVDTGLTITPRDGTVEIGYGEISDAFRGLGIVSGWIKSGTEPKELQETNSFEKRWLMLDVSRNAAVTVDTAEELLCRMALMGINGFMLYTETNFEVPKEPYWGYHDGRYSVQELSGLDTFAFNLGIEMMPCIQTLGHLTRALQWDAYSGIKDTSSVLLAGEDATYKFLQKIIEAAVKPYRSSRIHLGMDEAWDLGLGNYLRKNGFSSKEKLMRDHLKQVIEITNKLKLKPMVWSDMFFRAASSEGLYRDRNVTFTEEDRKGVPDNLELVFWDYYNHQKSEYNEMMAAHKDLTDPQNLIFATGTQSWNRLWPCYPSAYGTIGPGIEAAAENGIKEVIITSWGDDGNESDVFSILPILQYFSELTWGYTGEEYFVNPENLLGSSGIDISLWENAGKLDAPPGITLSKNTGNLSKVLLWEDPLWGTAQPSLPDADFGNHWSGIVRALENSYLEGGLNGKLEIPYLLAEVLRVKWDLPSRIRAAYSKDKRDIISRIAEMDIPELQEKVRRLWEVHRRSWFSSYKAYGWEIIENRYGGLLLRLETVRMRLMKYFNKQIPSIEELDEPLLPMKSSSGNSFPRFDYHQIYGPTKVPALPPDPGIC